jgi:ATP-dependent DNA ligase
MKIEKFKFFHPERPRLLHIDQPLLEILSKKKEWVAERKYNGSRLQLHYLDGKPQFWNRHEARMDYSPTEEILEGLKQLPGYCLLDGELRHKKVKGVRDKIMFYDVFIWNNKLLIGQPFWYRRNFLKKVFKCNAEPIGITEQFPDEFENVFHDVIKDDEIEGLVMKNTRGVLNLGRTAGVNSSWMYKCRRENNSYRF